MPKVIRCAICGKLVDGYGHNAEPVKKGLCCSECNQKLVIPARLNLGYKRKEWRK